MICSVVICVCCIVLFVFVFCKQKTAYERRISDWSSDVCSSDLRNVLLLHRVAQRRDHALSENLTAVARRLHAPADIEPVLEQHLHGQPDPASAAREQLVRLDLIHRDALAGRSEEHTSELQSLMRISYAVFCLKTKIRKLLM